MHALKELRERERERERVEEGLGLGLDTPLLFQAGSNESLSS
jgi:hypothetical protein